MPEPQDFSAPSPVVTGDPDTARPADVQAGPVRSAECIPPNSESGPVPDPDPEPEAAVPANTSPPTEPALPPLPPQEFRIYNRLAEQMDYFVSPPPRLPTPSPSCSPRSLVPSQLTDI